MKNNVFSSGLGHSLYLKANGTVFATGYNGYGQLGINSTSNQTSPVQITSISNIVSVACGYEHSLFLKSDGTCYGCGYNGSYTLGDGTTTNRLVPTKLQITNVIDISGGDWHTAFLKKDGTCYISGGDSPLTTWNTSTVQKVNISNVIEIGAGESRVSFLKSDGTVWGLGTSYSAHSTNIVQIAGLTGIKKISQGNFHALFLKTDGTVYGVGDNGYGQLGNGSTSSTTYSNPAKASITGVIDIACGYGFSLFLKTDGTVYACGYNGYGQLCDGTTTNRTTPVKTTMTGVAGIATGMYNYCSIFLMSNGTIKSVGYNGYGQLGIGSTSNTTTPTTTKNVDSMAFPAIMVPANIIDTYTATNKSTYYIRVRYVQGNKTSTNSTVQYITEWGLSESSYNQTFSNKAYTFAISNINTELVTLNSYGENELIELKKYLNSIIGTVTVPNTKATIYKASNGISYYIRTTFSTVESSEKKYTIKCYTEWGETSDYGVFYASKNHEVIPTNYSTYNKDLTSYADSEIQNCKNYLDTILGKIELPETKEYSLTNSNKLSLFIKITYEQKNKTSTSVEIDCKAEYRYGTESRFNLYDMQTLKIISSNYSNYLSDLEEISNQMYESCKDLLDSVNNKGISLKTSSSIKLPTFSKKLGDEYREMLRIDNKIIYAKTTQNNSEKGLKIRINDSVYSISNL